MNSLLIAPIYTASRTTGGGQRTINVARALSELGAVDVMLLSEPMHWRLENDLGNLARESFGFARRVFFMRGTPQFLPDPIPGARTMVRKRHAIQRLYHRLRPRGYFYRATPETRERFRNVLGGNGYELVVARYLRTASASGALDQTAVPVAVDLDDLDDGVIASRLAAPTTPALVRPVLGIRLLQIRALMSRLIRKCGHVFVSSAADLSQLKHASASVLPNIPFVQSQAVTASALAEPIVLFVGTFMHRPNADGVMHFLEACWPRIRASMPSACLRIVGSGGWEEVKERLERVGNVVVVGQVDSVASEYARSSVCICPVLEGAGTKIKVLEGLLYARPVVVMQHSARGYERLLGKGIVVAGDDLAFADRCVALLRDPEAGRRDADEGRKLVEREYSQEAVNRVVGQAARELAARSLTPVKT